MAGVHFEIHPTKSPNAVHLWFDQGMGWQPAASSFGNADDLYKAIEERARGTKDIRVTTLLALPELGAVLTDVWHARIIEVLERLHKSGYRFQGR